MDYRANNLRATLRGRYLSIKGKKFTRQEVEDGSIDKQFPLPPKTGRHKDNQDNQATPNDEAEEQEEHHEAASESTKSPDTTPATRVGASVSAWTAIHGRTKNQQQYTHPRDRMVYTPGGTRHRSPPPDAFDGGARNNNRDPRNNNYRAPEVSLMEDLSVFPPLSDPYKQTHPNPHTPKNNKNDQRK